MVVDVVPETREEYLRLHAAVWPQVEQALRECHVTNDTIFAIDDTLLAYHEYVGTDHAADMARIAEDPAATDWREATELWHLAP